MMNHHFVAALAVVGLSLVGCAGNGAADRPDVPEASSSRRLKEEIVYVSASELEQLKEEIVKVRLATFRYKQTSHRSPCLRTLLDVAARRIASFRRSSVPVR